MPINGAPDNLNTLSGENDVVVMQNITKTFPGIRANDNITIRLRKGEIHALLGENGAGKSTLMSILFGIYTADSGSIFINGKEVRIKDPNDANRYGIGMVHQHFMLIDCFTGLQNIILGAEPADHLGILHPKKVRKEIEALCDKYNFHVDLDVKVQDMPVGMQQKVEILKMLYRKNSILIFDEPTAVLTPQEIDELIASMKGLVKEGKSILFISHKLNEIMDAADRVSVLRKGKYIGTVDVKNTNIQELSNMMVGRPVQLVVQKGPAKVGKPILCVRNLTVYSHARHKEMVKKVSFDVRQGEITCIAGIEGNGQSELIYGITGLMPVKSGHVYLANVDFGKKKKVAQSEVVNFMKIEELSIRKRNNLGVSHIPEDRHRYGLVLDFPLKYNMVIEKYFTPSFSHHGWMDYPSIQRYSDSVIAKYDVRSGEGSDSLTRSMSGGNQQKAIVGRELDRNTPLLIACQPTRGLDVGAIEFIHAEIVKHRDGGEAILLMSLELEEVFNLADRILVMHEGKIVAELDPKKTTMEEIGLYMSGAKKMDLPPMEDLKSSDYQEAPVGLVTLEPSEDKKATAQEEESQKETPLEKTEPIDEKPDQVKPQEEKAEESKKALEEKEPLAEPVKEDLNKEDKEEVEKETPAIPPVSEVKEEIKPEPLMEAKAEEQAVPSEEQKPAPEKVEEVSVKENSNPEEEEKDNKPIRINGRFAKSSSKPQTSLKKEEPKKEKKDLDAIRLKNLVQFRDKKKNTGEKGDK
jgi:simple sugar transport system ATP-binding protein